MTFEEIINLLLRKIHYLLIGIVIGAVISYGFSLSQETTYEGRAFVSIGTNWIESNTATPAWDATQATEDFAETMIGIIKGSDFSSKVNEGSICNASTFEKSNLIITCSAKDEAEAEKIGKEIIIITEEIIEKYNANTSTYYSIGYSTASINTISPSLAKNLATGMVLGFLVAAFFVLLSAYIKKFKKISKKD